MTRDPVANLLATLGQTASAPRPEFAERLSACRALCDEFRGSSYTLAAVV